MVDISKRIIFLTVIVLLLANFYLWQEVLAVGVVPEPAVYFLDVGQGDSQLVVLGEVKVLIDGGEDQKVLGELESILSDTDKYIDLVILSHANIDHYGGLLEAAKRYQIGAFVFNGKGNSNISFAELRNILKENEVPEVVLVAGDRISYQGYYFSVLSPNADEVKVINDNEASLVVLLTAGSKKVLFTGDIGKAMERQLVKDNQLRADILKIAHHGSRNSSSREFITEVNPKISVIEVGRNSYGHPSGEVIKLLAAVGSTIYRTDKDGTVRIPLSEDGELPPVTPPPSPLVYKISFAEINPGEKGAVTNEFIKIHNAGSAPVNLDKWTLKKQTASGKEYVLVSRNKFQGKIPAGGDFLIAHRNYQGIETPDLFYSNKSNSLAKKNNTVILYDNQDYKVAEYSY